MRRLLIVSLPLLLTGCVGPVADTPSIPEAPVPAAAPFQSGAGRDIEVPENVASGTFSADGPDAITYDPRIVPVGATAQLALGRQAEGIIVRLAVTGMLHRRTYGAHLHTKPCGAKPVEAGPHYQHNADPKAAVSPPSVDPSFANPRNEVWLDFTADGKGAATSTIVEQWAFDETSPPRSLVVHMTRTHVEPGHAGTAGDRVACLTIKS